MGDGLLLARLAETVAWCDSLSEADIKRAEPLAPPLFHDGPDDLVCRIGHARQSQLRYRKLAVPYQPPVVAAGRFMLYFPDQNLCDGYAQQVSNGFFDVDNVPACNTWVSFFDETGHALTYARRYLLCYVPVAALAAADAGIEGNPEECIVWLEQAEVAIRRRVEEAVREA